MSVPPLLPGQAFSFVMPMDAYSYKEQYPNCIYDGCLVPASAPAAGTFLHVVTPDERLIADDQMFMDILGHWSLTAGVWSTDGKKLLGSMTFHQLLGEEYHRHFDWSALQQYKQRDAVEIKDVGWPDPTPESLAIQVRVLSRYGADASIETRRRRFQPIQWRDCETLQSLPLEEGVPRAIELLRGYQYVPDPAAALRERGFSI